MTRLSCLPELALALVLVAMPFVFPHVGGSFDFMERTLDWGILGIGFDLLFGWTGLLSFGQAAFYGTGGFVAVYLLLNNMIGSVWLALAIGTVAAGLFGLLVGWFAVRRIGIYFAMITLAFGQMAYLLEFSPLRDYTGGENGRPACRNRRSGSARMPFASTPVSRCTGCWPRCSSPASYSAAASCIRRSAHPARIKENTARAAMLGHAVPRYKLAVFVIAAMYRRTGRRPAWRVPEFHAARRFLARHLRPACRANGNRRVGTLIGPLSAPRSGCGCATIFSSSPGSARCGS